MSVHVSNHPLIQHKLSILRNVNTEPKKFRQLIRELAALLTYEATADMVTAPVEVQTPLAVAQSANCRRRSAWCPSFGLVWGWWRASGN